MRATTAKRARLSEGQIAAANSGSIVELGERYGLVLDPRKSRPANGDYWALCPFHQERTASLHIVERGPRPRFKCFGCGVKGDRISFHCLLTGMGFRASAEALGGDAPCEVSPELLASREQARREMEAEHERRRVSNRAAACAIYAAAVPLAGTLGDLYAKRARRIRSPLAAADLRFHARAPLDPYQPGRGDRCPAIVAAIRNAEGEQIGTHVTFLLADGSGKRCFAHLGDDARMICGEHAGGFIRLGRVSDACVISEGWETALSASEACGIPALAALNAPNMRALVLPPSVRRAVIAFDRDRHGVGEMSAEALAQRLCLNGVAVEMFPPPDGFGDWNDAAKAGALPQAEACA